MAKTPKRASLQKKIGTMGFFSLAFGSMIGVGWLTAMGGWLTKAGPGGAMLAFGAGGVLMLFIGLCYAELTPMMPVAGGEVAYAYKASGTRKSFIVGWFLAFGYISVSAFEAISIGYVLSFMFPAMDVWPLYDFAGSTVYAPHMVLGFLFTGLITALNYGGVQWAARFQTVLTAGFIAVTVIFIFTGLLGGDLNNIEPVFSKTGAKSIVGGMAMVFVTVPFWFVGFDTIPQGAEEAEQKIPPKLLGTLILTSIVAATLFYIVLILSVSMVGPWSEIASAKLPTAEAFSRAFGSPALVRLILFAALIGLLTSWNGFFLAGSRVLFALGRARIVPEWLGATHPRFGTPHNAVLFVGVITLAGALLGRGAMIAFVDVGSFCIAVAFFGVSQAAITLRRTQPKMNRPYRIPGGTAIPRVAVLGSLFILLVMVTPGSPGMLVWPTEWAILAAFVVAGIMLWYAGADQRNKTKEKERARLILGSNK